MIITKDISPKRNIYYLGAKTLEIIKKDNAKELDFFDIFQKLNETEKVSVNLFNLILDWLFLLGVVKSNNGRLERCF